MIKATPSFSACWILSTSATTHGTLYSYDQRVPLILYGTGVKKGRFTTNVTPADIAPSLGALVGIPFRTSDGHELALEFALQHGGERKR